MDKAIEDAREENVVQIVIDNALNNMATANMLKLKRPTSFGRVVLHTLLI